jgi:16S rRNA (guanine527-N7)-methyltransferase
MIAGGRSSKTARQPPHADPSGREADRTKALTLVPVSRETEVRLDQFVDLLTTWQRRINLIAPSTEPKLWTRHIADSLQLLALAPGALKWADLGSGGGFPGVVLACALADVPGAQVHLVESNMKKAAFLREAVRVTGAPATVHATRIVDFVEKLNQPVDVVTARALAPLCDLLPMAYSLLKKGARGLFPKGQDVAAELTEAAKCWNIEASLVPSVTDPAARIVVIERIRPRVQS